MARVRAKAKAHKIKKSRSRFGVSSAVAFHSDGDARAGTRDAVDIATTSPVVRPVSLSFPRLVPLLEIEDNRRFYADTPYYRPKTTSGAVAVVRPAASPASRVRWASGLSRPLRNVIQNPARAILCVRRQMRRQVLFSMRKAGRGIRVRSPRWNDRSFIFCHR